MQKQDNTILIAAGITVLAAVVLSQSGGKEQTKPLYSPIKGGSVEFITKMYPFALAAHKVYPAIPYQLFLTFAGLESGFGKHAPQWNFFGTKTGKNYHGKSQLLETHEILPKKSGYNFPQVISITDSIKHQGKYDWRVKDYFRAFNSPYEAFLDFGAFISRGCYAKALTAANINEKLAKLKACGYATDPDYVAKQMKLVSLVDAVIQKFVH